MTKGRDWDKVGEIVAKVRELGLSFKDGAKRFGVKPGLLYDYNKKTKRKAREAAAGTPAKEEPVDVSDTGICKSTNENPVGLPGDVGHLIRTYRREHPAYGFKRIQDILKGKYLVVVSRKQIRKVLKDAGLLETCDSSFDVSFR
jgi:transposase